MIEPLTLDDCHRTLLRLAAPLKVDLRVDDDRLAGLVRAHHELWRATAVLDEPARVLELVTQLLPMCAGMRALGGDLDNRFGIDLTDDWLTRNGHILLPDPDERLRLLVLLSHVPTLPVPPRNEQLDAVRSWAARTVASTTTGRTLGEEAGLVEPYPAPLRCFVACPLTNVPDDAALTIRDASDEAASALSRYGILADQPVQYTSPAVTPRDVNDPAYRSIDELLIARSDLVLVIAARASSGLGVVASTAVRYRKPLVVAAPAGVISPMITGQDPAPTMVRLEHVHDDLAHHLERALPTLRESSQRTRLQLLRIAVEQNRLRGLFDGMPTDVIDMPRHQVMNRSRFQELVNHPELFAGATVLEVRELYELAGE